MSVYTVSKRLALVLAPLAAIVGCLGSSTDTPAAGAPVSYYKDVEPIVQGHCLTCHSKGGIAPFQLDTYEAVKGMASAITAVTKAGTMPPWGTTETSACAPRYKWKNDPRLNASELATLQNWETQGTPAGDPKDSKAYAPGPRGLENVSETYTPQGAFTVTETTKDSFRCFVIDPKLTETKYINGSDIIPGNQQVVHHVLLFKTPDNQDIVKKQLGPDGGYDCFGGVGLSNPSLVMGWVPGAFPQSFPEEIGTKIDPGTMFVMQIHYHPHAVAAVNSTPDLTKVQMRFSKTVPPYEMTAALIGNFDKPIAGGSGLQYDGNDPKSLQEFKIPPNAKDVTILQKFLVPPELNKAPTPDFRLYGVGAHMHYVGTKQRITVKHGSVKDGEPADGNECLLDMGQYDFNWQRVFQYESPIASLPQIRPLDTLSIKCTYDNSLGNPLVAAALKEQGLSQPKEVTLGEETLNEMCLGVFQILTLRK